MDSPCFVLSISMLSILGISLVGLQIASFYTPSFTEIGGNNPCCWRDIILASDYWIGLKMASMDSPHWVLLMEMLWHAFCSNLIHDLSHLFTSSVQYKFNSGIYTYLNMTATSLAQNRTPLIQNRTLLTQNRTHSHKFKLILDDCFFLQLSMENRSDSIDFILAISCWICLKIGYSESPIHGLSSLSLWHTLNDTFSFGSTIFSFGLWLWNSVLDRIMTLCDLVTQTWAFVMERLTMWTRLEPNHWIIWHWLVHWTWFIFIYRSLTFADWHRHLRME